MVEVALLVPWIFFLFVGVLDMGFYSYAIITSENAARVAALQTSTDPTSSTNSGLACTIAMNEMQTLTNVAGKSTCANGAVSSGNPVAVTATCSNITTGGACSDACSTGDDCSAKVSVVYLSIPMIPIPGILPAQMTITRNAEMRVGG